jgi:hypothetical protein
MPNTPASTAAQIHTEQLFPSFNDSTSKWTKSSFFRDDGGVTKGDQVNNSFIALHLSLRFPYIKSIPEGNIPWKTIGAWSFHWPDQATTSGADEVDTKSADGSAMVVHCEEDSLASGCLGTMMVPVVGRRKWEEERIKNYI